MKKLKYFSLTALMFSFLLAPAGLVQAKDLIFTMGYGNVEVIDGDTDTIIANIILKGWTREYTFTPDRKRMVVSASRHYLHIIDVEKLQVTKSLDLNKNKEGWDRFIYGMTAAPDGKSIYAHLQGRRAENGEVIIADPMLVQIDLDSGEILRSINVPRGIFTLLSVKGGQEIYAIGQDLYKFDVSGKEMKMTEAHTHSMFDKGMNIFPLWHYTFESDGYFIAPYYTMEGCGMLEINTHTGEISENMLNSEPPFVYSFMYSPDRSTIYGGMDELYKIDAKSRTIIDHTIINEGTNFSLMVSSDGKKVYTGAGGSTVSVFDAETLKLLKVIQMDRDSVTMARLKL
jgi:WD40 repeat protein